MQTLKGSDFNWDFPAPDEGDEFLQKTAVHMSCLGDSYQKSATQEDDKRIIGALVPFPNKELNWSMLGVEKQ